MDGLCLHYFSPKPLIISKTNTESTSNTYISLFFSYHQNTPSFWRMERKPNTHCLREHSYQRTTKWKEIRLCKSPSSYDITVHQSARSGGWLADQSLRTQKKWLHKLLLENLSCIPRRKMRPLLYAISYSCLLRNRLLALPWERISPFTLVCIGEECSPIEYRNNGSRRLTIVRRIEGDITVGSHSITHKQQMSKEIKKVCPESDVEVHAGSIHVEGNRSQEIRKWLSDMGF